MPFCSIHHCVLLLINLIFTTVPTQAFTSVMVKLNQSAVLPCEQDCSGFVRWTVADEPHEIVAQCNYTSCWSKKGFKISHDEYLKGNLSLNITAVDYSNRGLYTCERDCINIINTVRLSIELRTLYIYLKPGEDLFLDVHMPGPKEVTYKSKDSTDEYSEPFCSVIQQSLQCKAEYTPRVALSDVDLILENVTLSDSGVYSVWDKNNNDINLNYIVSVKRPQFQYSTVKHHGSVTLPCTRNCSDLVKWTHQDSVVAWCNQTSRPCHSDEGYKMSHDQYIKGDFSLTITEAEYRMRGIYACKCNNKDISVYHVIIEAANSSVQLKPGEDLLMDLPTPDTVEVTYNETVIFPNDPNIKSEQTHRLSNVLKLGEVKLNDSGVYIVQDMKTKEVLYNYTVFVTGNQSPGHNSSYEVIFETIALVEFIIIIILGLFCYKKKNNNDMLPSKVQ
ncbi:uncharacterized protein LOC124380740 isoform X1 [Silurus meridionalis]|uniref:uncharacterized protein LOC124380740 isoform X1 n=1 Tax=Silurus meridionalis TaxID=175797 RepID=UPI001EE9D3A3|nr:uncharacterized protein LOC124380740 isoform X1 [Silurus meridionalis]XP_046697931.1 uncharacterized protein LOC124380740 isoform X1 [Silurus meridionalis]